ncbi:MAG: type IX secretion system membrane protein PorP/SprF [Tannerella sp.]|jgi:type IX secretion system PorP/SprF family membrane protein|nr:type IX secretion system membrane protein PorP/SprF [Tannerella sp.]
MKRIVLLLIIIVGCAETAQAQYDAQFSQYFMAPGYYNPAVTGASGNLDATVLYRLQWVGFGQSSPKTLFATANMPFSFMNKQHGIGVVIVKDDFSSIRSNMFTGLQYAFPLKIGKGTLRFGLQASIVTMTVDGTKVILPVDSLGIAGQPDEAIPTSKIDSKTFDVNLGIYFNTEKFYVGAASTHLLEPQIDEENLVSYIEREYNFIAGYNIKTNNPLFELQPSVFAKTNLNMYQIDVTARAVYAKRFSGGLSWRMNDAIVLLLGATVGKIQAGYAYDFPTTAIRKGTMGSHELFLRYKIQLNKPKVGMSKHKSVRFL